MSRYVLTDEAQDDLIRIREYVLQAGAIWSNCSKSGDAYAKCSWTVQSRRRIMRRQQ
jgi:hypothetical protein